MPNVDQLLNMSPVFILIGALNFLMWIIKFSFPSFPKNKIPVLCLIIGGCVFPLTKVMSGPLVLKILMGIIIGGGSVGLHQTFVKQLKDKLNIQLPGETEVLVKTSTLDDSSATSVTSVQITSTPATTPPKPTTIPIE